MNRASRTNHWELVYTANKASTDALEDAEIPKTPEPFKSPSVDAPAESHTVMLVIVCLLSVTIIIVLLAALFYFYYQKNKNNKKADSTKEDQIYPSIKVDAFPSNNMKNSDPSKHRENQLAPFITPTAPLEECLPVQTLPPQTSPQPFVYRPTAVIAGTAPLNTAMIRPNPTTPRPNFGMPQQNFPPRPSIAASFPRPMSSLPSTRLPAKRGRPQSPEAQFLTETSDLWFVIQTDDNACHVIDINNNASFYPARDPLESRINYEEYQEITFFDERGNEHRGTILFKGPFAEAHSYLAQLPSFESPETQFSSDEQFMFTENDTENATNTETLTIAIRNLTVKLENMQMDNKAAIERLIIRISKLENKKPANNSRAPKTQLKSLVNGIPRALKDIPNIEGFIWEKIQVFRNHSAPIECGTRGDIRDVLYSNQGYFTSHYESPVICGGAILKLLVGPDLAKEGFLPNAHYDKGPHKKNGQTKKVFSFAVTSAFYLSLDLLIANIFIADHRLMFHSKARSYVNQNVDTLANHQNRKGRDHAVTAYPTGEWIFTREEALKDDFNEEKEMHKDNIVQTYNWVINLGMSSALGNDVPASATRAIEEDGEELF